MLVGKVSIGLLLDLEALQAILLNALHHVVVFDDYLRIAELV